jgi:hypothetical protein
MQSKHLLDFNIEENLRSTLKNNVQKFEDDQTTHLKLNLSVGLFQHRKFK